MVKREQQNMFFVRNGQQARAEKRGAVETEFRLCFSGYKSALGFLIGGYDGQIKHDPRPDSLKRLAIVLVEFGPQ